MSLCSITMICSYYSRLAMVFPLYLHRPFNILSHFFFHCYTETLTHKFASDENCDYFCLYFSNVFPTFFSLSIADGDKNGFSSLDAQSYLKNGLSVGASSTTSNSMSSLVNGAQRLKPNNQNAVKCKPIIEEHDVCFSSSCACHEDTRSNCTSSCTSECSETCWGDQFIGTTSHEYSEPRVEVEGDLAYFSSIGPTSDGRWKPDVVAPGFYIASAHSTVTNTLNKHTLIQHTHFYLDKHIYGVISIL